MNRRVLTALFAALIVVAVGCGDDDETSTKSTDNDGTDVTDGGVTGADTATNVAGSDTGSTSGGTGMADDTGVGTADEPDATLDSPVSQAVTAATGGTVAVASGAASINIPAGGLAADTTITVTPMARSEQPDAANLGSNAFDFGPDGTAFLEPVTITLNLDVTAPEGKTPVLAVLEDGVWNQIAGSTVTGNGVSAPVKHFSSFVILFVDDELVLISMSEQCEEFSMAEIQGCAGGDVVGTWKLLDFCGMLQGMGQNPFADTPECQDTVYAIDYTYDGTLTFANDGTYSANMSVSDASGHYEVSEACLNTRFSVSGAADGCARLGESIETTCALANGWCTCDVSYDLGTDGPSVSTGTYATSGNVITMESDDASSDTDTDPAPTTYYCVSGDRFTVAAEDDGSIMGYLMERL